MGKGRQPEYNVKKVRAVAWVHPKNLKKLKALSKRRGESIGKIVEKALESGAL